MLHPPVSGELGIASNYQNKVRKYLFYFLVIDVLCRVADILIADDKWIDHTHTVKQRQNKLQAFYILLFLSFLKQSLAIFLQCLNTLVAYFLKLSEGQGNPWQGIFQMRIIIAFSKSFSKAICSVLHCLHSCLLNCFTHHCA